MLEPRHLCFQGKRRGITAFYFCEMTEASFSNSVSFLELSCCFRFNIFCFLLFFLYLVALLYHADLASETEHDAAGHVLLLLHCQRSSVGVQTKLCRWVVGSAPLLASWGAGHANSPLQRILFEKVDLENTRR